MNADRKSKPQKSRGKSTPRKTSDSKTTRKQAEEALQAAELKYRMLVERLPVAVYTSELGINGIWRYIGPQIEHLLGFTAEEWLSDPGLWYRQVHPDDRDRQEELEEQAWARNESFEGEYRIFTRDGRLIWIRDSAQILPPQNNGAPIVQGVLMDVTERKQAEAALSEAETKYRTIVEQIPNAVTYIDSADATIGPLYVSPQVEEMLGYTPEEWKADPRKWHERIHPDDQERILAEDKQHEETGKSFSQEYRMIARDGREVWIHDEATMVRESTGRPQYSHGIMIDITERKHAEMALHEMEQRYRTIVEQIPAITYVDIADGSGRSLYISPQIEELLKVSVAEWMRSDITLWEELLHPEDRERVIAAYLGFSKSDYTYDMEYRVVARDGRLIWFHDHASLLLDESGKPALIHGVMQDITERKLAEQALHASEERLGAVIEGSQLGYSDWHIQTGEVQRNERWAGMLGYTLQEIELTYDQWEKLIHPDDRARARQAVQDHLDGKTDIHRGEYRMRSKDGTYRWILDQGKIVEYDEQGRPLRMTATHTDITERKQAEVAVRASEERFRALTEATTEGIVFHEEGRILDVNPALVSMWGYEQDSEITGRGLLEFVAPESREHVLKQIQSGNTQPYEAIGLRKDGSTFPVEAVARLYEYQGRVVRVASIRDITERKQAEQMQSALYGIANVAQTTLSLKELYASIHKTLGSFMPAENFYIAIYDSQNDLLGFPYFVDQYDQPPPPQKPGKGLTEYVLHTRQPLLATPQVFEELINRKQVDSVGMDSVDWIGVPLTVGDETFGVMVIQTYTDKIRLTQKDLGFLTFVSTQAAMVIKRKQADEELRLTQQHLTGLITSTMDAVISINDEHKIVLFNPAAEKMFGYQTDEVLGQDLNILLPEYYRADHTGQIDNFAKTGFTNRHMDGFGEIRGRRRNGEEFSIDTSISQINIAGRKLFTAILRDITDRKKAEETLQQRTSQLEALREIGLELTAELDVDKLLHSITSHSLDLLHSTGGGIYLYRPEQNKLEWVVAIGTDVSPLGTFLEYGEGLSGKVWQQRKPMIVDDYEHWEGRAARFEGKPFKAVMGVPIIKGDEFLGVLVLLADLPQSFNIQDASLLELFAGYAAVAIHNARLYQSARQRLIELEVLYKTSNALSVEHDLNTLLRSIVDNARRLLHAATSGMYLTIPGSDELELSMDTAAYIPLGSCMRLGEGVAGHVAQTRQPIRLDDYSTWEGRSPLYEGIPIRAVLEVPMLYSGELIGVLTVDEAGKTERKFTEEDERLLSLFASQAAGAIHSARLFEETRRRAEEFEGLYQTTRDLSIQRDLSSVLTIITQHATKLLDVPNASINLYDPLRSDLELVASIGPDLPLGTRRKVGDGLSGQVAQSGQPLIVEDYQHWEHRSPLYDEIPYTAMMGVPLLYGGNLLGVLDVSDVTPSTRTFNQADMRLLSLFAGQAASAIENARLFEETVRRLENLESLRTIDNAISGNSDVALILEVILGQVISQLGADAAVILLFDPAEQILEFAAGRGFHTDALQHTRLTLGEGYAGRVAREQKTVHIPDIRTFHTDFLRSPTLAQESFISYYGVPLIAKGELKGVLEVFHRAPFEAESEWLNFLETLSGQTAIAIDNTALYKGLQNSNIELTLAYDATIEGWSRALDLRDKETEGHTQRVTEITIQLAKTMGVSEDELVNIRRGALLHDIGKMGVPDSILLKPGELTVEEWDIMHKHPVYALEMLTPIAYLKTALDIPYCHHEKWDGNGYPRGLKGEDIPLAARIFAVVDVWDAIRSDRPYRQGWDTEKAIAYIKSQSGTYFDPNIVGVFLNLLRE